MKANSPPNGASPSPVSGGPVSRGPAAARAQRTRWVTPGLIGAIVLPLGLIAIWQLSVNHHFWEEVWAQKTLFPVIDSYVDQGAQTEPARRFDLTESVIPVPEILAGGPPKDGIPALTDPAFMTADEARGLPLTDRVVGFVSGDEARAYPIRILNYHELVNDTCDDLPILVTYCPLCDSAAIFDRRTALGELEFGVSGLLFNNNVLLYNRHAETESLWSQIRATGVSGPAADSPLESLPVEMTTWGSWLKRYPQTLVLSPVTGYARDYGRSPYAGYFQLPGLRFPARPLSNRLPLKSSVLGVWTDRETRAYPKSRFTSDQPRITDTLADGKSITIYYDGYADSLRVEKADAGVRWMYSMWFAWYAFHPETEVYSPEPGQ